MSAILCISLANGTDKNEASQLVDQIAEDRSGRDRLRLVFIPKPTGKRVETSRWVWFVQQRSDMATQHGGGVPTF